MKNVKVENSKADVITMSEKQGLVYVEPKDLAEEEMLVSKITAVKDYTEKLLIQSSIEIGAYLTRAKSIMKHGQWGKWLTERVAFSQRTANNLMAVYEKFGEGNLLNSQALSNLNLTQAIRLLAVPDDEIEEFVEKNNALELSTRELEKCLKEANEQKALQGQAVAELTEREKELNKGNDEKQKEIDKLNESIRTMAEAVTQAEAEKNMKVQKLTEEAVSAEREKLAAAVNEKAGLEKELAEIKAEQKVAVENAVKEAEEKTRLELENKYDADMSDLRSKLEAAGQDIAKANEKASEAEKYYRVSADLQKFAVLTEQMEGTFNEVTKILIALDKNDSEKGTKIRSSFENVVESMVAKLKLSVAAPKKQIS
ncbi:MAG: DUF3102 domain-containing protein [Eubacteriales bacterium]|nr:DUF3102 domain-containing protein [Eubacteriales bacterium]